MINQNHQYYQLALSVYPKVVNYWLQSGRISQPEAQFLMSKSGGPEFTQFVGNIIQQIPALNGEQHMAQLLGDNLLTNMVNYIRQNNGMMMGGGMMGGMMGGGGGGMYFGGPRMMGGGVGAGGGGWFTGQPGAGGMALRGGGIFRPGAGMGGGQLMTRPQNPQQQPKQEPSKPEVKDPPKQKWEAPVLIQEATVKQDLNSNVSFNLQQFNGYDGSIVTELFVVDDRPRYINDDEAIAAYKQIFDEVGGARKFMTVCYKQLKVLRVDRDALKSLIKSVAAAVGNINVDDVAARIKAIMTVSGEHTASAVSAYHKFIIDEINDHIYGGELVDNAAGHRTWKVLFKDLAGLYDMLVGNVPKDTRTTLHQIANFDGALKKIVMKVIDTVVLGGTNVRILDPNNDPSVMDIYGRAIQPVWKNGANNTWEATENFFVKYLATKKTVAGSKTESSVTAEQMLHSKLQLTNKNFSVIQVPRIITWCNCPSSSVVVWDNGSCVPRIFTNESCDNDLAYFLDRTLRRVKASKGLTYQLVPYNLVCEVEEGRVSLNYGHTSEDGLWCGQMRFKK